MPLSTIFKYLKSVNAKLTSDLKKNVKYENSIKNLTVFIITIEAQIVPM